MSESTITVLIAAAILIILALFVPCMESFARMLGRKTKEGQLKEVQPARTSKRKVA